MKKVKKYKRGYLPGSQYDKACNNVSTYRGTMQVAAQKGMKMINQRFGGAYSSYKILDQIERM